MARALSVAWAQTDVEVEVIVVDDGVRTPVSLPREESRTQVIRMNPPGGVAAARNRGVAAAGHEWVAFLDDDDIWSPSRLRRLLDTARPAGASIVAGAVLKLDGRGQPLAVHFPPPPHAVPGALRSTNVLGGPSGVMVRRELLEQVGGFDVTFSVLADWELWIRLADTGTVATCSDVLTGYVVHPDSMHVQHLDIAIAEFAELGRRYGLAVRTGEVGMSEELFTRWVATAHRLGGRRLRAAALFWRNWRRYNLRSDLMNAVVSVLGERNVERLAADASPAVDAPGWLNLYRDGVGGGLHPLRCVSTPARDSRPPA